MQNYQNIEYMKKLFLSDDYKELSSDQQLDYMLTFAKYLAKENNNDCKEDFGELIYAKNRAGSIRGNRDSDQKKSFKLSASNILDISKANIDILKGRTIDEIKDDQFYGSFEEFSKICRNLESKYATVLFGNENIINVWSQEEEQSGVITLNPDYHNRDYACFNKMNNILKNFDTADQTEEALKKLRQVRLLFSLFSRYTSVNEQDSAGDSTNYIKTISSNNSILLLISNGIKCPKSEKDFDDNKNRNTLILKHDHQAINANYDDQYGYQNLLDETEKDNLKKQSYIYENIVQKKPTDIDEKTKMEYIALVAKNKEADKKFSLKLTAMINNPYYLDKMNSYDPTYSECLQIYGILSPIHLLVSMNNKNDIDDIKKTAKLIQQEKIELLSRVEIDKDEKLLDLLGGSENIQMPKIILSDFNIGLNKQDYDEHKEPHKVNTIKNYIRYYDITNDLKTKSFDDIIKDIKQGQIISESKKIYNKTLKKMNNQNNNNHSFHKRKRSPSHNDVNNSFHKRKRSLSHNDVNNSFHKRKRSLSHNDVNNSFHERRDHLSHNDVNIII